MIQTKEIIIINSNNGIAEGLKKYLLKKFGGSMSISIFNTGYIALNKINNNTSIVILDNNLPGEKGSDLIIQIKIINPKTEVIMISSNEDVGKAIDAFRKGASNYVVMGNEKAWKKISSIVLNIVMYPIKLLVQEFGVSKFVAIFLFTFVTVGLIAFFVLKYMHWNI